MIVTPDNWCSTAHYKTSMYPNRDTQVDTENQEIEN